MKVYQEEFGVNGPGRIRTSNQRIMSPEQSNLTEAFSCSEILLYQAFRNFWLQLF